MKKSVLFFAFFLFAVAIGLGIYSSQSTKMSSNFVSLNIEALADNHGGNADHVKCFNVYNTCWFWNCSKIYRCGQPCTTEKADSWSDEGICHFD